MRFRVGYHVAEPIGERDRESYGVERGNGTMGRCCGAAADSKGKTYEEINGDQWTEGPVEERSGSGQER